MRFLHLLFRITLFLMLICWNLCAWGQTAIEGTYYTQEVHYEVEDASEVFLVWGINGWLQNDTTERGPTTFVDNKILYTPMEKAGNTYAAKIRVPMGGTLECIFLTEKSANGTLRNAWDTNGKKWGRYNFQTQNEGPFRLRANFQIAPPLSKKSVLTYGWKILLPLLLLALIATFAFQKLGLNKRPLNYPTRILITGLSLCGFYLIIRLNILTFGMSKISLMSKISFYLIAACADDFLYVGVGMLFFWGLGLVFNKPVAQKRLGIVFLVLALISLLISMLNIGVVENLGGPFTYQWLYYSDFLGSKDAKAALVHNLSLSILFNMLAILVAMPLFAYVMGLTYRFLPLRRIYLGAVYGSVMGLFLLTYAFPNIEETQQISGGKLSHPVSAFLRSAFSTEVQGSLLRMDFAPEFAFSLPEAGAVAIDSTPIENVLLIVLESTGAEYLDLYGGKYTITPTLNAYFAHSALFENIYAHAPSTNKSLSSLMCAIYPWISYLTLTQEKPDYSMPSLSSEFHKQGFRTSFFTSSDFTYQKADNFLFNRSFDQVDEYEAIACSQVYKMQDLKDGDGFGVGIDDACLVPHFSQWIDADTSRPFFSVFWTNQAHYPYFISGEERNFNVSNRSFNKYLNALQRDDTMIGMAIDSLKARGLFESTLIAIIGDHGEAFGQHNQSGHGNHIYEENLHIPLILINPQLFRGERHATLGGIIDLAPTLLGLAGFEAPDSWQGRSLFQQARSDKVFFFAPWTTFLFGYRNETEKIIFNESEGTVERYDLHQDPKELHNLWQKESEETEHRQRVASWIQYHDQFIQTLLSD